MTMMCFIEVLHIGCQLVNFLHRDDGNDRDGLLCFSENGVKANVTILAYILNSLLLRFRFNIHLCVTCCWRQTQRADERLCNPSWRWPGRPGSHSNVFFSLSWQKISLAFSLARSDFCATGNRQNLCWNLHIIGLLFRTFFKDSVLVGKRFPCWPALKKWLTMCSLVTYST